MSTQIKETKYYVFWTAAMVAFIVPQVFTAYAYMSIKDLLNKPIQAEIVKPVEVEPVQVEPVKIKL